MPLLLLIYFCVNTPPPSPHINFASALISVCLGAPAQQLSVHHPPPPLQLTKLCCPAYLVCVTWLLLHFEGAQSRRRCTLEHATFMRCWMRKLPPLPLPHRCHPSNVDIFRFIFQFSFHWIFLCFLLRTSVFCCNFCEKIPITSWRTYGLPTARTTAFMPKRR